jgi:DNA-binding transcriptional ArsR family regulator
MTSDLLTTVRRELDARLSELRPLRAEYERLVAAVETLDATAGGAVASRNAAATIPRGSVTTRSKRTRRSPVARAAELTPSLARGRADGRKRERAPRGAARQAILAALEHGSHTASELASVTAVSAPSVQGNLRRLLQEGTITKAKRDGKSVYALPSTSGGN